MGIDTNSMQLTMNNSLRVLLQIEKLAVPHVISDGVSQSALIDKAIGEESFAKSSFQTIWEDMAKKDMTNTAHASGKKLRPKAKARLNVRTLNANAKTSAKNEEKQRKSEGGGSSGGRMSKIIGRPSVSPSFKIGANSSPTKLESTESQSLDVGRPPEKDGPRDIGVQASKPNKEPDPGSGNYYNDTGLTAPLAGPPATSVTAASRQVPHKSNDAPLEAMYIDGKLETYDGVAHELKPLNGPEEEAIPAALQLRLGEIVFNMQSWEDEELRAVSHRDDGMIGSPLTQNELMYSQNHTAEPPRELGDLGWRYNHAGNSPRHAPGRRQDRI